MEKKCGTLVMWDEIRGFGFVSLGRTPEGVRISRFLHAKFIERVDCENGIPQVGCEVLFNEALDPRGPIAVDAEVLSRLPRITTSTGLENLSGEPNSQSRVGQ